MKGHAGYAESGSDIYCAAVSVLAINTANSLEALLNCKLISEMEEGFLEIHLMDQPDESTELLFQSMVLGLKGIQNDNENKILKVIFKEV